MMVLGGSKLFVQAYPESDRSCSRLHGHSIHGDWAEFERRKRGLSVSFPL